MQDPTVPSSGAQVMATWLLAKGEDRTRAFLRDQEVVPTRDRRQLGEWLVRGRYPIVMGISLPVLQQFETQGLDIKHVKPLADDDPGQALLSYGTGSVGLLNHAPHPNAAKVLVNWLLTSEGQALHAEKTTYNSRRLDVPVVDPAATVDPRKAFVDVSTEEAWPNYGRSIQISNEYIK
jgi:ABC-type Fe3+ transport system substrate-binding protein